MWWLIWAGQHQQRNATQPVTQHPPQSVPLHVSNGAGGQDQVAQLQAERNALQQRSVCFGAVDARKADSEDTGLDVHLETSQSKLLPSTSIVII